MLTVACVYKTGGDYTAEYVARLRAGVERHLTGGEWACVSDDPKVATHRLFHGWPGWWSKIELFRLFAGPTLYLDLDTVITGDLSEIAAAAERYPFVMLSDFFHPRRAQSGVMAWHGDQSPIYREFADAPGQHMMACRVPDRWGDGGFVAQMKPDAARWQDVAPGQIVSRKVAATRNPDERVVCFHGRPRPHEVGWRV